MKINIYYGGRGILDDPTLFVITKMTEVLTELNVNVERFPLYELRNQITSLPASINEADGIDEASLKYEKIIDGMKCHTIEDIRYALEKAGFSKVASDHHGSKPWIAVVATK